jgi:hypothetical protein
MDKHVRLSLRKYPYFDGIYYAFLKIIMRVYLQSLGYDAWELVKNSYETPTNPLFDIGAKKLNDNSEKYMNAILEGLSKSKFTKFMHCKSTKEIWDKLQNTHEGDDKVKQVKLQTYRIQFESMNMNGEENIAAYLLRVYEIVNIIRGLRETIDEQFIVQKLCRSLPMRFNPKISTHEDIKELDKLTMDELHGILTTYEMQIGQEVPIIEATFKASKKTNKIK